MDLILQIWGGSCYLTNKMLFSLSEGRSGSRGKRGRVAGWIVYLLGVPPWVIILLSQRNWIAASIEAGGIPAMVFGLVNALGDGKEISRRGDRITSAVTYAFILLGLGGSLLDRGGLVSLSQFLEILVTAGFLLGSYLLAKRHAAGWLFFMLMNGSMGALMLLQGKPVLAMQQGISLGFVIYGYAKALGNQKSKS